MEILKNILLGIGAGIVWGILGYLKSPGESFDPYKFLQTVVIGGIVGGIGGFLGMKPQETYEQMQAMGIYAGFTMLVEYIKKAIIRRLGVGGEA